MKNRLIYTTSSSIHDIAKCANAKPWLYALVLCCSLLLVPQLLCAQTAPYTVRGVVTDSLTAEPLPYTSVYFEGTTEGAMTDDEGRFYFTTHRTRATLVISAVGYDAYRQVVRPASGSRLRVKLRPATYALNEVVVKPRRQRYSKKENPAVRFVREMIARRDDHAPSEHRYWQRDRYEKITFAINNFDSTKQKRWLYRSFDFLQQYVDTSVVTERPVLPVSNRELLATDFERNAPAGHRQWVKARRQAGVDDMLPPQGVEQAMSVTMTDIDLYSDNITLFTNKFVSPLSKIGPNFYKYYLMDTLSVGGQPCVDLAFVPYTTESFGFTGHLYVMLDSTYFVHKAVLNLPRKINLNFVDYMAVEQRFDRAADGTRRLMSESITTELKLVENSDGIYARRDVNYRNYRFELTDSARQAFARPERQIESRAAMLKDDDYWARERGVEVNEKETSVDKLMRQLRSRPVYYWTEKIMKIAFTGYMPLPKEKEPLIYYGPVNTTFNGNALEGLRMRVGGMTTAGIHPHLFVRGYGAYGTKDTRWKGLGELEYSFHPKKDYANEFPIHSVRLSYYNDVNQYGQNYLYTSKDNMFLALKRKKDDRIGYIRKIEGTYTKEYHSGFSMKLIGRYRRDEASYLIPFIRQDGTPVKEFQTAEVELKLRYSPGEKFYQTQWNRFRVSEDAPVFSLQHIVGLKDVLGGDYRYHYTEAGFQKRFWFSAFGYTDVILKGGKVWNKVPFPLLIIPNANLSYTIQPESYSLMNAMEFMTDEYASWDVTYYLNGTLFNRIPLLRRLKWREVVSCRGLYGHLSNKNNPARSDGLFAFPAGSTTLGDKPYIEAGVGIENIFKVLRVDYVWRLNYRDQPGVDTDGVRISLHVTF